MSKKFKGFSLAELLIALLVISIVLSAAIPTLTRKSAQDREQIWKWSQDNNSTYFGLGANQSVLIGTANTPMDTSDDAENPVSLAVMMTDDKGSDSYEIDYNGPRFTTDGDKLVILKKSLLGNTTNMANSHISFYNINNGASTVTDNITYGGRIAVDKHNLAFGRATLLHMANPEAITETNNLNSSNPPFVGENTAVGHFALMNTTFGEKNVAVGEKTLTLNKQGSENTAIGYIAGNQIGYVERENQRTVGTSQAQQLVLEKINDYSETSSYNSILGSYALSQNRYGFGNTSLGAQSLFVNQYGDENTALGYYSIGGLRNGYGNTAIGANACNYLTEGNYNICIGNSVVPDMLGSNLRDYNFGLAIGATRTPQGGVTSLLQNSAPLITGHVQRVGHDTSIAGGVVTTTYKNNPTITDNQNGYFDKELIVNAKDVEFKPFHGGNFPTFVFTSVPGDINNQNNYGYGENNNLGGGVSGSAFFNLRYFNNVQDSGSVTMQFKALQNKPIIAAFDPNKIKSESGHKIAKLHSISFNELIKFDMPDNYTSYPTWIPAWRATDSDLTDKLRSTNQNVVGIVADNYTNSPGIGEADIFINNRLNVTRRANHLINIDDKGTQIIDMGLKMPFEVNINGNEEKPSLKVTSDNISMNSDTNIEFDIAGSQLIHINNNGVTVGNGKDLFIEGLSINSSSGVKAALNYLNQEINRISQIAGTYSDARLKNISGDSKAGLAEINKIEVKNYTYKNDEKKTPHVGVIAQQLQKIFPNSVIKGEDGYLRIKTEEIFYAMVNSIKELCAKLQDLTAKVVGLDKRITELEAQNKMLLEQNKAFEKRLEKLEKQAAK
ncbi:MAG: tail fiber domain-containing protein [Candidatus Gastranaerophilales bacterium]|nr:tail fiber domain-containing protein [Candidatus Gastranaerophilales bacterium]